MTSAHVEYQHHCDILSSTQICKSSEQHMISPAAMEEEYSSDEESFYDCHSQLLTGKSLLFLFCDF